LLLLFKKFEGISPFQCITARKQSAMRLLAVTFIRQSKRQCKFVIDKNCIGIFQTVKGNNFFVDYASKMFKLTSV